MTEMNLRFRRMMAVVRIGLGVAFCVYGGTKLFDPLFFASGFQNALSKASATAADWYFPVIHSIWMHPGMFAVGIGMLELFLGFGLVLGLATRPVCLVGMLYMLNKMAITWYPGGHGNSAWQFLDVHMEQLAVFGLLLLFLVGRAGETWGLGAVYHSQRSERRPTSLRESPEYRYLYEPDEKDDEKDTPVPHE